MKGKLRDISYKQALTIAEVFIFLSIILRMFFNSMPITEFLQGLFVGLAIVFFFKCAIQYRRTKDDASNEKLN